MIERFLPSLEERPVRRRALETGIVCALVGFFIGSPVLMLIYDHSHTHQTPAETQKMLSSSVVMLTEVFHPGFLSLSFGIAAVTALLGASIAGWTSSLTQKALDAERERRVAAERQLEAEALEAAVFAAAIDGICVLDQNFVVARSNDAMCTLCGRTCRACGRADLEGTSLASLFEPDFDFDHFRSALATTGRYAGESRLLKKNAPPVAVEIVANAIEHLGAKLAVVVVRNISERQQIEKRLRHAQRMETLGTMSGGLAHDFNNLLAIFQTHFELLGDYNVDDPTYQNWIATGIKTVERGSSITRRLLAFSRGTSFGTETVSVNELIGTMQDLLVRSLTPRIETSVMLQDGIWPVDISPAEFQDAIMNLAINAADAMPHGGLLRIRTENVQVAAPMGVARSGVAAGDYVLLSLSDTGCGIAPEDLDKVFEPFFTTKEIGKGTGLGLSMVYGFVGRSRGHIEIHSDPGRGTRVDLWLPRSTRAGGAAPHAEPLDEEIARRTGTVLLVDDEAEIREATSRTLEALGYRVIVTAGGREALRVLETRATEVSLVLSDVVMPGGLDGYRLAAEIRRRYPGLKLLLISGFADNILAQHADLDSDVEFLSKPFTKKALARRIRSVIEAI